ncbi:MAG: hypothetical protein GWN99_11420 [Gemmatimonadetes bacterium]|uniref:Outer membrane protein beta-barrel domain-containing protein n=1 Tax=Candidatus Kutchimonas denitrificans TaxID=3056748 RepID=A0AAE4Z5S4_9BACT|nr:hypothetical protein [Gemmatimonadota bacterium]NIR74093.1 hypothetical protein [Candidatus Kutchimonas denitrificans]NIS01655.1 hypothetical protein [Gemmatimonadota bacterium]NIT67393.1 hypothetical protein [Gemmatimonadota bacterium]NIU52756.1 hypothetical protein [Gemmatimonadota bacterium]
MLRRLALVLVAGSLLGGTAELFAQADAADDPVWGDRLAVHDGFWISFGLGGGRDFGDEEFGSAGYIRLGGTVKPRWLVGGEVVGIFWEESEADISLGNVTFTVIHYPAGGFFLKGGVGFGGRDASVSEGDFRVTTSREGLGLTLGSGFEIRLGRNFFLTPGVDLLLQTIDGGNVGVVFSLGATWH